VSTLKKYLSDIGQSSDLRQLVSTTDITPRTITLVLDKLRTLEVTRKSTRDEELIVHCKDGQDTIILHLPFASGAKGAATIISYNEGS
jgi:hypothetical protein